MSRPGSPTALSRRVRGAIVIVATLSACHRSAPPMSLAPCAPTAALDSLVLMHSARYPAMHIPDALKLLQQATLGSEHWAVDSTEAASWMTREWSGLADGPVEPMVDTLGQGGLFARINLRPFQAAGGSPDVLVAAFLETGRTVHPGRATLACAIDGLMALARRGAVALPADSIRAFATSWASQGYPALDHSPEYEKAYQPAYRVVALSLLQKVLATTRTTAPR